MRVSTEGLYRASLQQLQSQQSKLATVQNQIATGQKIQQASQDPGAASQILRLDVRANQLEKFAQNASQAELGLNMEELALSDAQNILQRVRELTIQGNSASLSDNDRASIAAEIRTQGAALLAIANREDGNGNALFGGSRGQSPVFVESGGVVTYNGDAARRQVEIAEGLQLPTGHPGDRVFQRLPEGNGSYTMRPGANTGAAIVSVQEATGFDGQAYDITITGGNFEVRDAGGTLLQSGVATTNLQLAVGGLTVSFDGVPANGDSFSIAPAGSRDIFTTVEAIANALVAPTGAARANAVASALQDLDQAQESMSSVRSEIGSRLNLARAAQEAAEVGKLEIDSTRSGLADIDYAEAVSRLTLQSTAYDAALQAFARTQQLSLFSIIG